MTFAGLPATTVFSGTFFVTTLPAPTTAPFPIDTPGSMIAPPPIHTSFPIVTGLTILNISALPSNVSRQR